MGCTAPQGVHLPDRTEIVYQDLRIASDAWPKSYKELIKMLLNIVEDAQQASDIVIEYSSYDGVKQIVDDTSL